jgi:hypothetical protein
MLPLKRTIKIQKNNKKLSIYIGRIPLKNNNNWK